MNEAQAKRSIIDGVKVTPHMVVLAKGIISSRTSGVTSSSSLEDMVLGANEIRFPIEICIHPLANPEFAVAQASAAFSWRLAVVEAIWSLIHEGMLLQQGNTTELTGHIRWTDASPSGSGGTSSGWTFPEFTVFVPVQVRTAPSFDGASDQVLVDGDLYLHNLNIGGMHEEVASSIREAIKCYRKELYTASVAMLGKASEGAWLELGKALIDWFPPEHASKIEKQVKILEEHSLSTIIKIKAINDIYNHRDIVKTLEEDSEVTSSDLRAVATWSDAIRDSRNTIHFGVAPALPNSPEKVSSLLIGAVPHLRVLYQLRRSAIANIFSRE